MRNYLGILFLTPKFNQLLECSIGQWFKTEFFTFKKLTKFLLCYFLLNIPFKRFWDCKLFNYSSSPLRTYNFTNCEISQRRRARPRTYILVESLFIRFCWSGRTTAACCSSLHKGDSKSRDDLIRALRYCATERKGGMERKRDEENAHGSYTGDAINKRPCYRCTCNKFRGSLAHQPFFRHVTRLSAPCPDCKQRATPKQ